MENLDEDDVEDGISIVTDFWGCSSTIGFVVMVILGFKIIKYVWML